MVALVKDGCNYIHVPFGLSPSRTFQSFIESGCIINYPRTRAENEQITNCIVDGIRNSQQTKGNKKTVRPDRSN